MFGAVAAFVVAHEGAVGDVDFEFFVDFADDAGAWCFVGFDVAAGEVPGVGAGDGGVVVAEDEEYEWQGWLLAACVCVVAVLPVCGLAQAGRRVLELVGAVAAVDVNDDAGAAVALRCAGHRVRWCRRSGPGCRWLGCRWACVLL